MCLARTLCTILKKAHHIKMAVRLSPLAFLALSCLVLGSDCRRSQRYSEELFLKHLPDGRVSATFQFTTTWDVHPLDISQPSNGEPPGRSLSIIIWRLNVSSSKER